MRIPYNPLPNPYNVDFEEKFHRYHTEGKDRIPSVTTIKNAVLKVDFEDYRQRLGKKYFSIVKKNLLKLTDISDQTKWEKIIGEIIGDYEMVESARIGSQTHLRTEQYDKEEPFTPIDAFAKIHFEHLKPYLDELTEINALEQPLTTKDYSYAGKPDRIGKYRGRMSVVDFKTKKSVRLRDWLEDHFIQEAAYADLWQQNGGEEIQRLVLLVSSRDNNSIGMEFIEEDPKPWIKRWNEILKKFLDKNY